MSNAIKLTKPIEAHGETLNELKLRELNTEDIMRCGYPMTIKGAGDNAEIVLQPDIAAKYISRLAGIPESSVKALAPVDFNSVMMAVVGFFGESGVAM